MSAKKAKKEKSAFGPISVNIVLFVIGLCLAIWADKVTNIMSIVLGVLLLLVASYYIIFATISAKMPMVKLVS